MAGVPGAKLVELGASWLNVPYLYGGTSRSGIDCSALMENIAREAGLSIPRTSEEQYAKLQPISAGQLAPGDLVFSAGSDGTSSHPGHVGMYVGNGQVLNAPHTGSVVRYEPLSSFGAVGYRRIPGVVGSATIPNGAGGQVPVSGGSDGGGSGGLFSLPGEVVGFFSKATDDLSAAAAWFSAFGKVSTWIRAGAAGFGIPLVLAGLVLLALAARPRGGVHG